MIRTFVHNRGMLLQLICVVCHARQLWTQTLIYFTTLGHELAPENLRRAKTQNMEYSGHALQSADSTRRQYLVVVFFSVKNCDTLDLHEKRSLGQFEAPIHGQPISFSSGWGRNSLSPILLYLEHGPMAVLGVLLQIVDNVEILFVKLIVCRSIQVLGIPSFFLMYFMYSLNGPQTVFFYEFLIEITPTIL